MQILNQLKDEMWNITGSMVKCVLSGMFIIVQCTLFQFSYPGHRNTTQLLIHYSTASMSIN